MSYIAKKTFLSISCNYQNGLKTIYGIFDKILRNEWFCEYVFYISNKAIYKLQEQREHQQKSAFLINSKQASIII